MVSGWLGALLYLPLADELQVFEGGHAVFFLKAWMKLAAELKPTLS